MGRVRGGKTETVCSSDVQATALSYFISVPRVTRRREFYVLLHRCMMLLQGRIQPTPSCKTPNPTPAMQNASLLAGPHDSIINQHRKAHQRQKAHH